MAQTKLGAIKVRAKKLGMSVEEYRAKQDAGLKFCYSCEEWKPLTSFGKDVTRYDGLSPKCLDCWHVKIRVSTKGRVSPFKGKTHSAEARASMSEAAKHHPSNRLGKPHSLETRAKISQIVRERTPRGEQCHSYKDGKLAERMSQRCSLEYKRWRYDVYMRDKFTCQHCGDAKGGNLVAHHIKPFAEFPELRFEVSNGITLCNICHDKIHDKPDSIRKRKRRITMWTEASMQKDGIE
jgi:5-methylcytosine-specific restriction endonuclease McrA